MTLIGDPTTLAFAVSWPADEPRDVRGLAWGDIVLWVAGRRHWIGDKATPIRWTWVDLIEHLARAWGHLLYEETAPFGLVASDPDELRNPKLLASVPGHSPADVEEAVHAFQHRHDLAAGLKGIHVPSVWLIREGAMMRVRAEGHDVWLPLTEVRKTLENLASEVAKRLHESTAPRAHEALRRWDSRMPSATLVLKLRTGLDEERLDAWTAGGQSLRKWCEGVSAEEDSPLMAAARLSAALRDETRQVLFEHIAALSRATTPALDELSDAVLPVVDATTGQKPYEQGYALALWLRRRLGVAERRIDPAALLKDWGVQVADLPPLEKALDAVACWGDGKGPAILLNPDGRYAGSRAGRSATLCHEIGHLLFDRRRHLPTADVFGGSTPLHLEQRAKAFAAELLLPREVAARAVATSTTLHDAVEELQSTHGASREVVAWQIRNGSGWQLLSETEKRTLGTWLRPWRALWPPRATAATRDGKD